MNGGPGDDRDSTAARIVLDVHTEPFDRSSGSHPWGTGHIDGHEFRFDGWVGLASAIDAALLRRAQWSSRADDIASEFVEESS